MAFGPGGEGTVTGTAQSILTIIAQTANNRPVAQLSILAPTSNTGSVAIGASGVTTSANRRVLLAPGNSFTWGPFSGLAISLDEIFAIGPGTSEKIIVDTIRA